MKFTETGLVGAFVIDIEAREDERGFFARTFCGEEFAAVGLPADFVQCNVSYNKRRGTLRGMHFQVEPYAEGKLVRCTRGAIFDVMIDLRPESPSFCRWFGLELSGENTRAVYIPPGFAHGLQTLADDSEVFYQMSVAYRPGLARGVRWNDPAFGIDWPLANPLLSGRDAEYPDFIP